MKSILTTTFIGNTLPSKKYLTWGAWHQIVNYNSELQLVLFTSIGTIDITICSCALFVFMLHGGQRPKKLVPRSKPSSKTLMDKITKPFTSSRKRWIKSLHYEIYSKELSNMYDIGWRLNILAHTSKIIQTEKPIQAPRAPPSADMKVVVV